MKASKELERKLDARIIEKEKERVVSSSDYLHFVG